MTEYKAGDYYQLLNPIAGAGPDAAHIVWSATPPVFGQIVSKTRRGEFVVRAYSSWCPEGETGIFNPSYEPSRNITKEQFEAAKTRGWI